MILYDESILFKDKDEINIEQYLYTALIFIKNRNTILDNDNADIMLTVVDNNILETLDNIDDFLNNRFLYNKILDKKTYIRYFTNDMTILSSKYLEDLIIGILLLIEYERNLNSTIIEQYITYLVDIVYNIVNNYRRFKM